MKTRKIFICEDSFEGILTGVFEAYICRYGHDFISLELKGDNQPQFFSEYYPVETDIEKARKVGQAIRKKISPDAYELLHEASLASLPEKAESIYRFLVLGFKMGPQVISYLSDANILSVMKLSKAVTRELQRLEGFVRFRELDNGIMFSKLAPKHDQLILLAPHFADRFPEENWMIYDEHRKNACIHKAGQGWGMVSNIEIEKELANQVSEEEELFLNLWKSFAKTITIEERKNARLQMNMMPKMYWKNMPEVE